ncbi:hypothetical protein [Roseivivax lentus]
MKTKCLAALSAALLLGACAEMSDGAPVTPLPEAVVAIAAPYQDLTTARLRSEDGCYWYSHAGPVETTLIPLRTAAGNPICSSAAEST